MPVLLAAGCSRAPKNNEAIRQAVIDHLTNNTGLDVNSMNIDVTSVQYRGDEADAVVSFQPKNMPGGGMAMNYTLEAKGNKWIVKKKAGSGMGAPTRAPRCRDGACGPDRCLRPSPMGRFATVRRASAMAAPLPAGEACRDSGEEMKRIAVIGGGPAGAFAAERLASAGLDTIVIDEKLAWEKPCGGGLTYKAYSHYPFLIENDTPKKLVTDTCLSARARAAST